MEPHRASFDLAAMTSEARDIIERTEQMLVGVDSHTGAFSNTKFDALSELLDHPFMKDAGLSRAEAWNCLELARLSRICGYPVSDAHIARYQFLRDAARRWIDRTGYMRPPVNLMGGKFPLIRQQIRHVKSMLTDAGMRNIRSGGSGGVSEVSFEFPAVFFGTMHGKIEVRTKYDGDVRFSVIGGYQASETVFVMGRHQEILGTAHYARFGLEPPEGMKFVMTRNDPDGNLQDVVTLLTGIAAYYRIDTAV